MENNTDFKVGDTVKLNSGGRTMTVIKVDGEMVSCQWFKKSDDLDGAIFRAATLKRVEEEDEDDIGLLKILTGK